MPLYKNAKIYCGDDGYNVVSLNQKNIKQGSTYDPSTLAFAQTSAGTSYSSTAFTNAAVTVSYESSTNRFKYQYEANITGTDTVSISVDPTNFSMKIRLGRTSSTYTYVTLLDLGYKVVYNSTAKYFRIFMWGYHSNDYSGGTNPYLQRRLKYGRTYYTARKTTFYNESFNIKSDALNEDFDMHANNAVLTRASTTVAWADFNTNMTISFTSITDQELLDAVEQGKTKIRVQLLYHQPCGGRRKQHNKRKSGIYLYTNPYNAPVCLWRRVFSHDPLKYGCTWKDLTKSELQSGLVKLNNVKYGASSLSHTRPGDRPNQYITAELYVPALGKGHPDTFEYERKGYRKVASNYISFKVFKHDKYL